MEKKSRYCGTGPSWWLIVGLVPGNTSRCHGGCGKADVPRPRLPKTPSQGLCLQPWGWGDTPLSSGPSALLVGTMTLLVGTRMGSISSMFCSGAGGIRVPKAGVPRHPAAVVGQRWVLPLLITQRRVINGGN